MRYPVEKYNLFRGTNFVVTGVSALHQHGLASCNPAVIEFETISRPTYSTPNGTFYINSGFLDENPVYDEELDLWYTSVYKAILDTITYTIDNSALEDALNEIKDDGNLEELGEYLLSHGITEAEWQEIQDTYIDAYIPLDI